MPTEGVKGDAEEVKALGELQLSEAVESTQLLYKITPKAVTLARFMGGSGSFDLALPAGLPFGPLSTAVFLPIGSILLIGGANPVSSQVLSLNLQSGHAKELRNMRDARFAAGGVHLDSVIYVFGGSNATGYLSDCECYSRTQKLWTPIPPMHHARAYFTPCVCSGDIYLFGGCQQCACEVFHPLSQEYTMLKVKTPIPGPAVTIQCRKDVVVLQTGRGMRLAGGVTGVVEYHPLAVTSVVTCSAPVSVGSLVVLGLCETERVLVVDIRDWSVSTYR